MSFDKADKSQSLDSTSIVTHNVLTEQSSPDTSTVFKPVYDENLNTDDEDEWDDDEIIIVGEIIETVSEVITNDNWDDDEVVISDNPTERDKDSGLSNISDTSNESSEPSDSKNGTGIKLLGEKPNDYLFNREKMWSVDEEFTRTEKVDLLFLLIVDTEFTTKNPSHWQQRGRMHISSQLKGIHQSAPKLMFFHKGAKKLNLIREMVGLSELPILKTDFDGLDYLHQLGVDASIKPCSKNEARKLSKCTFTLYAHFATAELNLMFRGSLGERIKELQRAEVGERIECQRRVRCITPTTPRELDYVLLDHIISINGEEYSLAIKIVDTAGLHGVASYAAIAKAIGWELEHKDNFSTQEKENMWDTAMQRPKDFENYALGDLDVYEMLEANASQFLEVYTRLGLEDYYQIPKLTVGGTVKDLFTASLARYLGIDTVDEDGNGVEWVKELNERVVVPILKDVSAAELRQCTKQTKALLAKVEGGRCRNNQPTVVYGLRKVNGEFDSYLLCDIDISGCYGEGQRNQIYPIGNPQILSFKADSENNGYPTLREWLKKHRVNIEKLVTGGKNEWLNLKNWGKLKNGCWHLRFSITRKLKYPQDFFASWFTTSGNGTDVMAKFINKMKCDSEQVATPWVDFDEEEGWLKIFNYEIHNGVLTHDGLEWLFKIATPRQRNDILDNCHVLTSVVYPASQELTVENGKNGLEQLEKIHCEWELKNIAEIVTREDGNDYWQQLDGEPHYWFGVNLGELLIDDLLIQRKIAQKVYGKKSPLDVLFKLCVNTLYGDMVSKYFVVANPVVGNNITARARALAWYMEKGLYGHESITDGCAFDNNKVLYPGRDSINGESINLHRDDSPLKRWKISRKPLGGVKSIEGFHVDYLEWDKDKPEGVAKKVIGLKLTHQDNSVEFLKPEIVDDEKHPGFQKVKSNPGNDWIDKTAMTHLQSLFPYVSVLHTDTTKITINDNNEPVFKHRSGQFNFETKDLYVAASFHGSANYLLWNENKPNLKARGYETKRNHTSISEGDEIKTFNITERYGKNNNPAKDFLTNLLERPERLPRQEPAIRQGILKVGDYKNLSGKYDGQGLEPGDNILRPLLMQEFSLSQFTFQTYDQYREWLEVIDRYKKKYRQSLETFFLNDDGTLNMVEMCETVDRLIAEGVMNPFEALDKHRNSKRSAKRSKKRSESKGTGVKPKIKSTNHPHHETYEKLCEKLKESES
ncbi:MAG: hypothetical protein F6K21_07805 [Symploca sp. SIO2D2]|nr:hypothetical protein [Symploca sp. SIO2D2]